MATILQEFLERGYFPKELPPGFTTIPFGQWALSTAGKKVTKSYQLDGNRSECVHYRLALPGSSGLAERLLSVPHPYSFAIHSGLIVGNLSRLLRLSGASRYARSKPVYQKGRIRPIRPSVAPGDLLQERMRARAGARFLLKLDVSQFYPSLYTHAVGWAVSPKTREKQHWHNRRLLGKRVDQSLMDMQGKTSQGIPIGPDTSFILAELVLAAVDREAKLASDNVFRWYDDYEVACVTRQEAEAALQSVRSALQKFRLRPNVLKTAIIELPDPSGDGWQTELARLSDGSTLRSASMARYFDRAFHLAHEHPGSPVLLYAMGCLFEAPPPDSYSCSVAVGAITQAVLAEPGCAQKAFALLTYWMISGAAVDRKMLEATIVQLCLHQNARGVSSDIAWALAFAIQHGVSSPGVSPILGPAVMTGPG